MLKIQQLQYSIMDFDLSIDSLEIKKKKIHALLGNSGAGKSTLLNLIAGHLNPKTGDIFLNEKSVLNIKPNKRNIALIFQDSLLFPHLNVYENIGYALKVNKTDKNIIDEAVDLWLNRIGLTGYEERMPDELSGGEKKRVAIARALITNPEVILMDEPFNGLDPKLRDSMLELITNIQNETSIAILYITHDFEEALKISDKISIIKNGRIIHSGTPYELLFEPKALSITDFFTYYNQKNVVINQNSFKLYNRKINSEKTGNFNCIIPPQGIQLTHGNEGVIIKKYYLKYGNIYQVDNGTERFYAFSQKHLNIGTPVDYSIEEEFIRLKKGI